MSKAKLTFSIEHCEINGQKIATIFVHKANRKTPLRIGSIFMADPGSLTPAMPKIGLEPIHLANAADIAAWRAGIDYLFVLYEGQVAFCQYKKEKK